MKELSKSFLGIVLLAGLFIGCTSLNATEDPIDRVAHRYGIERKAVLDLAEELGVDSAEIDGFGPYYFPFSYYEYLFKSFEQEQGRPPRRSEVEQMVKGYVAKCDEGRYGMSYIFYSTNTRLHSSPIAMVVDIGFQLPKPNTPQPADPLFSGMQPVELWDGSVNPPGNTYYEECVEAYLGEP